MHRKKNAYLEAVLLVFQNLEQIKLHSSKPADDEYQTSNKSSRKAEKRTTKGTKVSLDTERNKGACRDIHTSKTRILRFVWRLLSSACASKEFSASKSSSVSLVNESFDLVK